MSTLPSKQGTICTTIVYIEVILIKKMVSDRPENGRCWIDAPGVSPRLSRPSALESPGCDVAGAGDIVVDIDNKSCSI